MKEEAESIYLSGEYVKNNPTWHAEDSGWKSEQIATALRDAGVDQKRAGPKRQGIPRPGSARRSTTPEKKWRLFIVYSHSSEILTCPGEGLRGTALVAARFG
jgi:hypothetical protein